MSWTECLRTWPLNPVWISIFWVTNQPNGYWLKIAIIFSCTHAIFRWRFVGLVIVRQLCFKLDPAGIRFLCLGVSMSVNSGRGSSYWGTLFSRWNSGGQARTWLKLGTGTLLTSVHILLTKTSHMVKSNISEVGKFSRRNCKGKW